MAAHIGTFSLMLGVTCALLGIVVMARGIATGEVRYMRLSRQFTAGILCPNRWWSAKNSRCDDA